MDGGAQRLTVICKAPAFSTRIYAWCGVPSVHLSLQDKEWRAEGGNRRGLQPSSASQETRCVYGPAPGPSVALVVEAFSDLRKNLRSCLPVRTGVHSRPPKAR